MRVDTCDYSVDPRVISRFVDIPVTLEQVRVTCEGRVVADHARCWARRQVITAPEHVAAAPDSAEPRSRSAAKFDGRKTLVLT